MSAAPPTLEVAGVWKSYGAQVLRGVTFAVPAGRITALLGANGAGKTTLFNIVTGFTRADGGRVQMHGRRLDKLAPYQISRLGLGRLFQDLRIFGELSVLDNLLVGLPLPAETALGALLTPWRAVAGQRQARRAALQMLEFVRLDVEPDRPAQELSYGQQKRLALGRALIAAPNAILLDEPSSGLDPAGVDQIVGQLLRIRSEQVAMLVIEHNRAVVERVADWVVFIDEGVVLREGPVDEVMADVELARRYLGQ